jgi:hypothetical protein
MLHESHSLKGRELHCTQHISIKNHFLFILLISNNYKYEDSYKIGEGT